MKERKKVVGNTTKVCKQCGKIGLLQYDFRIQWENKLDKYYYKLECKECECKHKRQYRLDNIEVIQEYDKLRRPKRKKYLTGYRKEWYQNRQNVWYNFLKELGHNKCSKCGYNQCFAAIDFHHIDPKLKKYNIGNLMGKAFNEKNKSLLLKEISKCVVLCSNCHRELHYNELK